MAFRTVLITGRSKLDLRLNYLVVRKEREIKIHLSEISVLILGSTAVSITAALMVELIKKKIKVIFCDEKHLPCFQLMGFYDNYHSSKQIYLQIDWKKKIKRDVWTNIIENKIRNQAKLLKKLSIQTYRRLEYYADEIKPGDTTNREGHAAKVYFNSLFGNEGRRVPTFYNGALNYGYAVILAEFCRKITAAGYLTQLGIRHNNEFNFYNLASDLMETYRIIVDDMVFNLQENDSDFKSKMANILNGKVKINDKNIYLDNAIDIYVQSVINALNRNDVGLIKNYSDYELPVYENNSDV